MLNFEFAAAAAVVSMNGDCMVLCSNTSPVGYNYRYCAAATKVFPTLRLSSEHKPTHSWWEISKHVTNWGLVKAEREDDGEQAILLIVM